VACLLSLPIVVRAASLREEAVTYRQEGYTAQQRGDLEAALTAYQKAAALDPSYPAPLNDAGILYEQQGRLEEARIAYEQALARDPNYLGAHANLALLYERLGQREKAIPHWLKRYELGESDDPWTVRAGERLVALGALSADSTTKTRLTSRRRVIRQELEANEQSLSDFQAVTSDRY